jgi:hypothetical protein
MIRFKLENEIFTNSKPIKSLGEYIDAVKCISEYVPGNNMLWFRGHAKAAFRNLPIVYRPETWSNSKYNFVSEFEAFKSFRLRSKITTECDSEYLPIMQHYGLPTRLLDWTESSLIALFFAINQSNICDNPVVWALNPNAFNKILHNKNCALYLSGKNAHPMLQPYIIPYSNPDDPTSDVVQDKLPENPIAVIPERSENRVIAQRSAFLLFGKNQTPIEELSMCKEFYLSKIVIDNLFVYDLYRDLTISGIDYYTIFPDIHGLVQEIKGRCSMK